MLSSGVSFRTTRFFLGLAIDQVGAAFSYGRPPRRDRPFVEAVSQDVHLTG